MRELTADAIWRLFSLTGNFSMSIAALFVAAILAALAVHALAVFGLKRITRSEIGRRILDRSVSITRLAVVLLGLAVVLPAADFDPAVTDVVRRTLRIGLAILLGWAAIVALGVAADTVSARYRIDVADNLTARSMRTQIGVLRRIGSLIVVLVTTAAVLLSFPAVEAYGVSLFASAGVASLILGFAARPILANLFAGIQIALTQPIRIDDVVIVEGEWGWVEEITTTYVVLRIWDLRRLVVPLSYFIEKPFQNWTRESAAIIGAVTWHVDYSVPVDDMRTKLEALAAAHPLWDRKIVNLQVVDAGVATLEVRALLGAADSSKAWDLRCDIREQMIAWLQTSYPDALPRLRASVATRPAV